MVGTKTYMVIVMALVLCMVGCQNPAASSPTADEQKAELLKQIEQKYESPEAHYQLGKLYHAEGLLEKARFEYQVALGFVPVDYRAQAALVKVFKDKNDADRSKLAAELYMSQAAVSSDASLTLGKAFQKEGLGDYALACYQQAAGLTPDSAEAYRLIGFHHLGQGDSVSAEENLRRSFELNPYQPDIAVELGRMGVMVQTPHQQTQSSSVPENTPAEQ